MKTVVGLYEHVEDAHKAVSELRQMGFANQDISLVASDEGGKYSRQMQSGGKQDLGESAAAGAGIGAVLGGLGGLLVGLGALAIPGIGPIIAAGPIAAALAGAGIGAAAGGIVGALVDLGIPEENAKLYAEGVRQGGTLVVVRCADEQAQQAASVLNRYNPIDVDRRSGNWNMNQTADEQRVGMGMSSAIPVTGSQTDMDDTMDTIDDRAMNDRSQMHMHDTERDMHDDNIPVTGRDMDTTIPVIEEDINVGKRTVDRGGVRVERTEEEVPFEEDVHLREERVNVERRPVNREATDHDFQAFQEGSMEFKETGEEPVVQKRARVVEEVDINKDVQERTETIRDTLRRQDVNVEQTGGSNQGMDWNTYDTSFRQDFQSRYQTTGYSYDDYQPAYRYGYDLGTDPRYRDYDWNRMESVARRDWEQRGSQSRWEDVKDAVQHAWRRVTNH